MSSEDPKDGCIWITGEGGESCAPIPIEVTGFTFTIVEMPVDASAEAAQLCEGQLEGAISFIVGDLAARMLWDLNDQLTRTCLSGHLHGTFSGRLFCDAMRDSRPWLP